MKYQNGEKIHDYKLIYGEKDSNKPNNQIRKKIQKQKKQSIISKDSFWKNNHVAKKILQIQIIILAKSKVEEVYTSSTIFFFIYKVYMVDSY